MDSNRDNSDDDNEDSERDEGNSDKGKTVRLSDSDRINDQESGDRKGQIISE